MTITLDTTSGSNTFGGSAGAKSVSLTIGSGSNRLLVALIGIYNQTLSSVTYNGVAMTLDPAFPISNGTQRAYIYYMLDSSLPSAGTYSLIVTPNSSGGYGAFACVSMFGAKQAAPEATGSGSSTGSPTSWANNITPLTNGAWIFDVSCGFDRTFTPGAGQTEIFDVKDGTTAGSAGSRKELASAGLTTMGQTPSSGTSYAQAIAAFAPFVETPSGNFFSFF